jgi:hypothetical protein
MINHMKKGLLLISTILLSIAMVAQEQKQVITGFMYANDVYYSLENGTVDTAARENWDIAFTTNLYSASILANTAANVELYTYTLGALDDWATVDTTGMTWWPMYNSLESVEEGAFSFNQLGHPDYGWGEYFGMGGLAGDSLYIIKTVGGAYKKLAILEKSYADMFAGNIFDFKVANLDGSDEQTISLNTTDYNAKNFVYYSLDSMEMLDREPASADWDLLFTKYTDYVNYKPYYHVSGVLTNEDHVLAQEVSGAELDPSTFTDYEESAFSAEYGIIGGDWKAFTGAWSLSDTVVYFLKKYSNWDPAGEEYMDSAYYKLYFTDFTGMSQGMYTFMQERLSLVSNGSFERSQLLEVYPNPASDRLNLVFDRTGETRLQIIDMTGRTVSSENYNAGGFSTLSLDIAGLNPGFYFIRMGDGNDTQVVRFIKE